jgi:5-hydroxyisourate hydrolase-like protein (transthyretin family)
VSTAGAATATTTGVTTAAAQSDVTTAKTATALSIAERKATIKSGQWDLIRGQLTTSANAPAGRRVVELYRYNLTAKKWQVIRMKLTGREGRVRFAVRPLATTEYEIVYHGDTKLAASHSSPITATVAG